MAKSELNDRGVGIVEFFLFLIAYVSNRIFAPLDFWSSLNCATVRVSLHFLVVCKTGCESITLRQFVQLIAIISKL